MIHINSLNGPYGSNGLLNTRDVKFQMKCENKSKLKPTTAGTAAYRNHLSCWRSSPCARCSRTNSEKSAARMLAHSKARPTRDETEKNSGVVSPPITPSTPNGT